MIREFYRLILVERINYDCNCNYNADLFLDWYLFVVSVRRGVHAVEDESLNVTGGHGGYDEDEEDDEDDEDWGED